MFVDRLIFFSMMFFLSVTTFAQDGTSTGGQDTISENHLKTAFETVYVTRTSRAYNQVLPNLARRAKARLIEKYPDLEKAIIKAVDDVALSLASRQTELDLLLARSWAEQFTEKELKEISAFYASPTGTKLAKLNTTLIAAGLDIARKWGAEMGNELISKVRQNLQAKGHKL